MIRCLMPALLLGCTTPTAGDNDPTADTGVSASGACAQAADLGDLDRSGDGVLAPDDLEPGQAAMHVAWTGADGAVRAGLHLSDETRITHGDYDGNDDRWAVWFKVTDADPESAAFVWFQGTSPPLTDGTWDVYTLSWDVPPIENGGANTEATGQIEVAVAGGQATGSVIDPDGPVVLMDYLSGGPTGETVALCALAFNAVDAELD